MYRKKFMALTLSTALCINPLAVSVYAEEQAPDPVVYEESAEVDDAVDSAADEADSEEIGWEASDGEAVIESEDSAYDYAVEDGGEAKDAVSEDAEDGTAIEEGEEVPSEAASEEADAFSGEAVDDDSAKTDDAPDYEPPENDEKGNPAKKESGMYYDDDLGLYWQIDYGMLTVDGGTIPDFPDPDECDSEDCPPWYDRRDEISSIMIEEDVYGIGDYAFKGFPNLTTVMIVGDRDLEESDTHWIGIGSFQDCPNLVSVSFSDISSLERIYDHAFYNCPNLQTITITSHVTTIDSSAFEGCSNLKTVDTSSAVSLQYIGDYAFAKCQALESFDFPDTVTHIGDNAFMWSDTMTSVNLPNGLEYLGSNAFCYSDAPEYVRIPDSLTEINASAFQYCGQLKNIGIGSGSNLNYIAESAFEGTALTSIYIPHGVTNIEDSAFDSCYSLSSVTYDGTKTDWNNIYIGDNNDPLKNASITYLRTESSGTDGNNSSSGSNSSGSGGTSSGGSSSGSTKPPVSAAEMKALEDLINFFSLDESKVTLYKGQKKKLTYFPSFQKLKWSSSNKKVATVNKYGLVTAKKKGKAVITARLGSHKHTCRIIVKNPTIKLSKKKLSLTAGETAKLKATVKGKSKKVKWKSSNKTIATVSSKGKITAKKAGSVKITVTANGKKATCKLTVKAKPVVRRTYSSGSSGSGGSSSYSGGRSYYSSSSGSSSSSSSSGSSGSSSGGGFSGSGSTSI